MEYENIVFIHRLPSEKIEFFDINALWIEYLKTAQKPYEFFSRDTIHPNDYGKAIIAWFLFYFFQT